MGSDDEALSQEVAALRAELAPLEAALTKRQAAEEQELAALQVELAALPERIAAAQRGAAAHVEKLELVRGTMASYYQRPMTWAVKLQATGRSLLVLGLFAASAGYWVFFAVRNVLGQGVALQLGMGALGWLLSRWALKPSPRG